MARNELDLAALHHLDGLLGQRLGLDEPLGRNQRLHDRFAAVALAEAELVGLDLDQRADLFQIGHHAVARFEAVQPGVGAGRRGHARVVVDHLDLGQVVALAGFEIVEVVGGRDFDHAGAELGVGQVVEDDRDFAIHQRQLHGLAVQVEIARVLGVDRDGGIAQHGLGTRGGDRQVAAGMPFTG